ncbi:hypothetical protein UFOVP1082_5 [uncultured Caudovirales phage]|uniref:Uncharacterized protein n=1 Tax=uncultured Caudovirales phage TaxID=2100421 RepID=A0A6J5SEN3_9CAUD|nr:hypothetical protein UFOVP906_42 [uncultured Caudovirales phage]CAB4176184.1 hypothetical protein UFOVP992_9 [uncultured Caudovirales phage]CAB4182882.1 hypothetical protein UFOVP1082_5 [uncultured Caudovirales phage]CAB4197916.1 hypothetical protein UFOVP1322_49 [uncultured Caudovirales phage]CAB4212339.1 hypothetical protein UFOVP1434_12 [uncultured Caudovirales phage]
MSEDTFVGYLGLGFRKMGCHVVKHNDINIGIPDLSVFDQMTKQTKWLEVKNKQEYPAKETTKIWWPHYTEQQALFLRKRNGFLIARIARDYYMFDDVEAWAIFENKGLIKSDLMLKSKIWWRNKIDWTAMYEELFLC